MKRLALALALIVSMPAHAEFEKLLSAPVSVALEVGKWLVSDENDRNESIKVTVGVISSDSPEETRKLAFDKALTEVFGKLTVSEIEVDDQVVLRNQIITATSGYVTDYEVVEQKSDVTIVDVWVSRARVEDRFLRKESKDGVIEGSTLAELKESLDKGDAERADMLRKVLRDFDAQAMTHSVDKVRFLKSGNLEIDVKSEWNKNYLVSLDTVTKEVSPEYDPWSLNHFRIKVPGQWTSNNYTIDLRPVLSVLAPPRHIELDFGVKAVCQPFQFYPLVDFDQKTLFFNSRIDSIKTFSVPMTIIELNQTDSVRVKVKRGWCS